MNLTAQDQLPNRPAYVPVPVPSLKAEIGFYLAMLYSLTADVWGISVPLLAAVMMFAVAGLCMWELRSFAMSVYAPVRLLLACAITYILIQIVFHAESIMSDTIRPFVIWMVQLIIVGSLCLRPGFFRRYVVFLFSIALLALPHLAFSPGDVERAAIDRELGLGGGFGGINGLGQWFGFFAIYFAIYGLETTRFAYRLGAWGLTVGSLFIVALTVSRGSLLAAALGIAIGFRGVLKRGFAPLVLLILLVAGVYSSGVFDRAYTDYEQRATEETGRAVIWPMVIGRIMDSPLIGVGASDVGTYATSARIAHQPHNTFLYFALSSGIVPVTLFIAFFIHGGQKSAVQARGHEDGLFRLPYLVFTLIVEMIGDLGCMAPWALLTLSLAAGSPVIYGKQRLFAIQAGGKVRFAFAGYKRSETHTTVRS
jgi:O-Antigen ligase